MEGPTSSDESVGTVHASACTSTTVTTSASSSAQGPIQGGSETESGTATCDTTSGPTNVYDDLPSIRGSNTQQAENYSRLVTAKL